jgi:signal transduction histidine kinase
MLNALSKWSAPRFVARTRTISNWVGLALYPVLLGISGRPGVSAWTLLLPLIAVILLVGTLRRHALPVLALMLATFPFVEFLTPLIPGSTTSHEINRAVQIVAVAITVGSIAATARRRVSTVAAAIALVVLVGVVLVVKVGTPPVVAYGAGQALLAVVTAWTIGNTVRQHRLHLEARRAEFTARAVQEERLQIARELHDMIAHTIAVVAVQAGMGRRMFDSQPDQARQALATIEATSRETLTALRRLLRSLRHTDTPALLSTAPGLADLGRLAEQFRSAELRVEMHASGIDHPLPPDVDLSAYRIVQEAITNVVRHAGATRCDVTVEREPGELLIEIVDDGRGGVGVPGYGVIGMRERVQILNGRFEAGARPDGGFRVMAVIPLPAETT